MSRPRLLFVVNDPRFFLSHRRKVAEGARAAGFEVHVAAPQTEGWDALAEAGFIAHTIRLDRRSLNPLWEGHTVFSLSRLYRRLAPDLVHHVTIKSIVYGGIAARIARVPAVLNAVTGLGWTFTQGTPFTRLIRRVACAGYRMAFRHPRTLTVFQNEDDRHTFVRLRLLDVDDTILIRGSGVDTQRFAPTPVPAGAGPHLVVFPGRLLHDKGAGIFVEAARILRDRGSDARFALVGGFDKGNRSSIAEGQVNEWVSRGLVESWGHRSDMPDVYRQARIVCLPSRREGVPLALLEAAACGRPVVTTDAPGCRDVVENGVTGRLVPVDDPIALANALEALLGDGDLCEAMGLAARARVNRLFASERIVGETLAAYRALLNYHQTGNATSQASGPPEGRPSVSVRGP